MDTSKMTRNELIAKLRMVANRCSNKEQFSKEIAKVLPGVAVTIIYDPNGQMFMGMAMSHYHNGVLSF